jgi:hypothetical protein
MVLHYEDSDFAENYPALYDLMTTAKRDGRYRAGARLSVFCDDGKLKASIWDPDTHQVWFSTLESFQGALEAIEVILQRGGGEWRERKDTNGKR